MEHPPHPTHMTSDLAAADASFSNEPDARMVKHKRRFCRVPGCNSIVKSQGLCQRHGAKPRKCKVDGCPKQAQGNFDGMCKSHFKAHKRLTTPIPKLDVAVPPEPEGQSVYDHVLRSSVGWIASETSPDMPLIKHLRQGFESNKPPAWHRNEERRARGLFPIHNPATQLEAFERELVWMEILLLSGVPGASFRHLARAWGRDKGFHMVLGQFICERRGNIERKKREKGLRDSHGSSDGIVGADAWDDTCYTGNAYNEALAADLLNLNSPHHHIMSGDEEDNATDSTSSHEGQLSSEEY